MSRIVVGPFNRVEGDLEVALDLDAGRIASAQVNSPLFRGFEQILVGRAPLALRPGAERTLGNHWPQASTLFDYIRRAMPLQAPGSLKADEVYALSAWLLHANGLLPEDAELDAARLAALRLPARERFVRHPD